MAQRTVHYLFGEMISKEITLSDKKRFLLGCILPDAIEPACRTASHFKVETNTRKYFDFEAFRNQFFDLILRDDLYLGYYLHLVEDAFYRAFWSVLSQVRASLKRVPRTVPLQIWMENGH